MKDTVVRILRDEKLLDEARLEECLGIEKETGQTLDRVLLQKGYLTEGDILRVFSRALGMPMVESLGDEQVPAEFVNRVPVNFARNYGLVAIGRENGTVEQQRQLFGRRTVKLTGNAHDDGGAHVLAGGAEGDLVVGAHAATSRWDSTTATGCQLNPRRP